MMDGPRSCSAHFGPQAVPVAHTMGFTISAVTIVVDIIGMAVALARYLFGEESSKLKSHVPFALHILPVHEDNFSAVLNLNHSYV